MQTELTQIVVPYELLSNTGMCDMCKYECLYEQWNWDQVYQILKKGITNGYIEHSVGFVQKLEALCNNPLLSNVLTSDMINSIDRYNWFHLDYDKIGGYYTEDPITKEKVHVPRRRIYFWDDELTDYEGLCQTIMNALDIIDEWVWEQDSGDNYLILTDKFDGEKSIIASIIDIYVTMIDMYFIECESEDEECDSVS